jgi:hypothetical protein
VWRAASATSATWGRAWRWRRWVRCGGAGALIFCFDALLIFALTPLLMAFGGASQGGLRPEPSSMRRAASSSTRC